MMRICLLCLAFLLLVGRGFALEVRETLWGFDGRVTPGRLSPLSIFVTNPGVASFDGVLVVEETGGLARRSGAAIVQPLFLAPGTGRWVQFHVFVGLNSNEFSLSWGSAANQRELLKPAPQGPPARVLLSDPSNPFAGAGGFKVLPDVLFPTTVNATDGLDAVVLDYVPRWEPARREAFIDWLKRGGLVLVLPGANGEFPTFTEQLAPLNITGDQGWVGAGVVLRGKVGRRDVTAKTLVDRGYPEPAFAENKTHVVNDLESTLFERLSGVTRPNLNWPVITWISILYLALIGPVHFFAGRKFDYRVNIGIFAVTVALFGYIFSVVGRRGYAESQTVHTLAIARVLDTGRYDVTQWSSAFATNGAIYKLTHDAPANLYSAISRERVAGEILNGLKGTFTADIPLYSSREFYHRAVMPGPKLDVTLKRWEPGKPLAGLMLNCGPEFPKDAIEIMAYYQGKFQALKRVDSLLRPEGNELSYSSYVTVDKVRDAAYNYDRFNNAQTADERAIQQAKVLAGTLPLIYTRAFEGKDHFYKHLTATRPDDRVQLFVAAPAPATFALKTPGFTNERGLVLYVQDLPLP